jgi:hypothetical protein
VRAQITTQHWMLCWRVERAGWLAVRVDDLQSILDLCDARIATECVDNHARGTWQEHVVRIEEDHNLASTRRKPGVERG